RLPPQPAAPDLRPHAEAVQTYRRTRREAGAGQVVAAAATLLQLLDQTRADPQAALWRELVETRLEALAVETGDDVPDVFTSPPCPPAVRLHVWKRQLEKAIAWDPPRARALLQRIEQANEAERLWLLDADGVPRPLTAWILRWLKRLCFADSNTA